MVSGGCIVSGGVFRSVLFSSVRVHSHSDVNWSVLLPEVQVGRGARLNRTVDDAARTVRHVGRAVETVNDNPQALLLGNGPAQPGPGESGFAEPDPR